MLNLKMYITIVTGVSFENPKDYTYIYIYIYIYATKFQNDATIN